MDPRITLEVIKTEFEVVVPAINACEELLKYISSTPVKTGDKEQAVIHLTEATFWLTKYSQYVHKLLEEMAPKIAEIEGGPVQDTVQEPAIPFAAPAEVAP